MKPELTIFQDFAKQQLLPEAAKKISWKEMMEKFQQSLIFDEITAGGKVKESYDFWKGKALGGGSIKSNTKEAQSALEVIVQTYIKRYEQQYKEKYGENHPGFTDFSVYFRDGGNGFLYDDIMKKVGENDTELARLMYTMISFFDRVSKLPLDRQTELLAQFPPQDKGSYQCDGGSQIRLGQVMRQMDDSLVQSFSNVVLIAQPSYFRFIPSGDQPHVESMLQTSFGFKTKDSFWSNPIKYVPPAKVWDFNKSFDSELRRVFADQSAVKKEQIKVIAVAFDRVNGTGDEQNGNGEQLLAFQSDIANKKSGNDYLSLLGVSDVPSLIQTFFTAGNEDQTLFVVNQEAVKTKLTTLLADVNFDWQVPDKVFEFNLHDEDAPKKIATILLNPQSTDDQKQLAMTALWILSERFLGNSQINFVRTMNLLGISPDKKLLPKTEELLRSLNENMADGIIRRFAALTVLDPNSKIKPIPNDVYEAIIKGELLSPENHIKYGITKAFLDEVGKSEENKNNFFIALENLGHAKASSFIFNHPYREEILALVKGNEQYTELLSEIMMKALYHKDFAAADKFIEALGVKELESIFETILTSNDPEGDYKKFSDLEFDIIKYLVNKGVKVDLVAPEEDGLTAFIYACRHGRMDMVEFLFDKGADVNLPGKNGILPFRHAVTGGQVNVAQFIYSKVEDKNTLQCLEFLNLLSPSPLMTKFLIEKVTDKEVLGFLNRKITLFMNSASETINLGVILDDLKRRNQIVDASGNTLTHNIAILVSAPYNKLAGFSRQSRLQEIFQTLHDKHLFDVESENNLGKTALEEALDGSNHDVAKVMFGLMTPLQQINALNRTTLKGTEKTYGVKLLKIIDQDLDKKFNIDSPAQRFSVKGFTGLFKRPKEPEVNLAMEDQQNLRNLYAVVKKVGDIKGDPLLRKIEKLVPELPKERGS